MSKEASPQVLIVGAGNQGLRAALKILMSHSISVAVVDSINDVNENIDTSKLSICPVDIPDIFKIKQKQKQDAQHWRGGSKGKGGKVGYERR